MLERLFATAARPRHHRGLHVCERCTSPFVQLENHDDAGHGHWHLDLRCPECETRMRRTVSDAACAELDAELEDGTLVMLNALSRVQHELMTDEIEAFAAALDAGFVLPEDF